MVSINWFADVSTFNSVDLDTADCKPSRELETCNHLLDEPAALKEFYEQNGYLLGRRLLNVQSITEARDAMLAVAVVVLPHYVRITRAAVISEMSKDYVTAARMNGAGHIRLMFSEVLPNCTAPLIVQASLGISTAILDAAALGFLGLGAQPPSPEWGTMLADAREFVLRAWWVVTFPGLAILITVLAFNLLGDGLRDAFDPKLKR